MTYPKCPKCELTVIVSKTFSDKWYCANCSTYYLNIDGHKPGQKQLFDTFIFEQTPELRWTAEEVNNAKDRGLAVFYGMLNDEDRYDFEHHRIDIHGDTRDEFEFKMK